MLGRIAIGVVVLLLCCASTIEYGLHIGPDTPCNFYIDTKRNEGVYMYITGETGPCTVNCTQMEQELAIGDSHVCKWGDGFECKLTKMDQTDIRWEYTLEGQCPDGSGNIVQLDGPENEQQEKPVLVTDGGNTVPPPLAVWFFGSVIVSIMLLMEMNPFIGV